MKIIKYFVFFTMFFIHFACSGSGSTSSGGTLNETATSSSPQPQSGVINSVNNPSSEPNLGASFKAKPPGL